MIFLSPATKIAEDQTWVWPFHWRRYM